MVLTFVCQHDSARPDTPRHVGSVGGSRRLAGARQRLLCALCGSDQHVVRIRHPAVRRPGLGPERTSDRLGRGAGRAGVRAVRSGLGTAGAALAGPRHLHGGPSHGGRVHAAVRVRPGMASGGKDLGVLVLRSVDRQSGSAVAVFGGDASHGAVLHRPHDGQYLSASRVGQHWGRASRSAWWHRPVLLPSPRAWDC